MDFLQTIDLNKQFGIWGTYMEISGIYILEGKIAETEKAVKYRLKQTAAIVKSNDKLPCLSHFIPNHIWIPKSIFVTQDQIQAWILKNSFGDVLITDQEMFLKLLENENSIRQQRGLDQLQLLDLTTSPFFS